MGAQAYCEDRSIGIYTTDASWLAVRLCQTFETPDKYEQTHLRMHRCTDEVLDQP